LAGAGAAFWAGFEADLLADFFGGDFAAFLDGGFALAVFFAGAFFFAAFRAEIL
jgi:hypothetical protein